MNGDGPDSDALETSPPQTDRPTLARRIGQTFVMLLWALFLGYLQYGSRMEAHNAGQWICLRARFALFDLIFTLWLLRMIHIWWQPDWLNVKLLAAERTASLIDTAVVAFVVGGIFVAVVLALLGVIA